MMMHWASLPMEFLMISVAPSPSLRGCVWRVATTLCFTFLYLLLAGALFSRVFPYPFVAVVRTVTICHKGDTLCSLGQARPQVFLIPEKAASVKRLDAVLGNVNPPSWCFIVVRHGGNAHRGAFCLLPLRRVAADIYPLFHIHVFQCLASWDPVHILSTL